MSSSHLELLCYSAGISTKEQIGRMFLFILLFFFLFKLDIFF